MHGFKPRIAAKSKSRVCGAYLYIPPIHGDEPGRRFHGADRRAILATDYREICKNGTANYSLEVVKSRVVNV